MIGIALLLAATIGAQDPAPSAAPPAQQPTGAVPGVGSRRPRPYGQVVNERARTERGASGLGDESFCSRSPFARDTRLATRGRIVGPTGFGGFTTGSR